MNRFRYWLQNFMTGRYGADQLNRFMLWASLGLMLLQLLFGRRIRLFSYFYPLALILLILCYFRMFSRNVGKRSQENMEISGAEGQTDRQGRSDAPGVPLPQLRTEGEGSQREGKNIDSLPQVSERFY